jgi:hypothetical protein
LEAMATGVYESHSRETQGKSQKNTAGKNDHSHSVASLPFKNNLHGDGGCWF